MAGRGPAAARPAAAPPKTTMPVPMTTTTPRVTESDQRIVPIRNEESSLVDTAAPTRMSAILVTGLKF